MLIYCFADFFACIINVGVMVILLCLCFCFDFLFCAHVYWLLFYYVANFMCLGLVCCLRIIAWLFSFELLFDFVLCTIFWTFACACVLPMVMYFSLSFDFLCFTTGVLGLV